MNRNRALNGDVVVITIIPPEEIKSNANPDSTKEHDCITFIFNSNQHPYLIKFPFTGALESDGAANNKPRNKKRSPQKNSKVKQSVGTKPPDPILEIEAHNLKVQENQTKNCGFSTKDNVSSELPQEEENIKENIARKKVVNTV